jgi:hypothetical protein
MRDAATQTINSRIPAEGSSVAATQPMNQRGAENDTMYDRETTFEIERMGEWKDRESDRAPSVLNSQRMDSSRRAMRSDGRREHSWVAIRRCLRNKRPRRSVRLFTVQRRDRGRAIATTSPVWRRMLCGCRGSVSLWKSEFRPLHDPLRANDCIGYGVNI